MAFDDMTALGALRALKKNAVRVPEDCSVVGFDDVAQSALSVPSLSTVRQPMETMGTLAVGIILDAIGARVQKGDVPVVRRNVPAGLMARESTQQLSR